MNFKKIIIYYLIIEIIALVIGYLLATNNAKFSPDYIGLVLAIACAVGFGLAFYLVFLLLKKKITISTFTIYFLLSLAGVVIPYFFVMGMLTQLH